MSRMTIQKQTYDRNKHTDGNNLSNALMTQPSKLSQVITHLSGREEKKFPLTSLTHGVGNYEAKEVINNSEYEYPIMGKYRKTVPLAESVTVSNPGIHGTEFTMKFDSGYFNEDYVITGPSNTHLKIISKPKQEGGLFEYRVKPASNRSLSSGVPESDLKAGVRFAQLWAPVAQDWSRGNSSSSTYPGRVRHKVTTLRKSYAMSGRMKHQVVEFQLPLQNTTTTLWMDFEEYQHMLSWYEECEMYSWYGEQSYNGKGETHLTDENGQPIFVGPGLLEQIPNKESYSDLTEKLLKEIVGDLFFGMNDPAQKQMTIFTGTGGFRMFDEAMKNSINDRAYAQFNPGMFLSGSGYNIKVGGFITQYDHVDGHKLNLVYVPMYDHGGVAETSPVHPDSHLPLESYRMTFIDQSSYDGLQNIQMITQKGRELLRWAVSGSVEPSGYETGPSRASDIDGAAVHFLKVFHILLRRYDTSLDLKLKLSN